MRYMFLLSGENVELAKEEVLAIANVKKFELNNRILTLTTNKKDFSRLAFTKKIYEFIFKCKKAELKNKIKKTNFNKFYKDNFAIRSNISSKEKELAPLIWYKLKNPKVRLENPKTQFEFIFIKNRVYCGKLIEKIPSFNNRNPQLRPGFHPSTLKPKLARSLVNLTRIKPKQTLLDPFCGSGAILIEAGLIGVRTIGTDLNESMINKTKKNLDHFKIKNYKLKIADATKIDIKTDAIATDPPYGRASSLYKKDIKNLYREFLDNVFRILKNNSYLVIIFPNQINIKSRFKKIKSIPHYVHKGLTRNIIILKKLI